MVGQLLGPLNCSQYQRGGLLQPGLGWLDGSLVVAGTRQGKLLKSEEGGNGWEEVDTGKGLIREMASHVVLRGQSAFAASCQESQQR